MNARPQKILPFVLVSSLFLTSCPVGHAAENNAKQKSFLAAGTVAGIGAVIAACKNKNAAWAPLALVVGVLGGSACLLHLVGLAESSDYEDDAVCGAECCPCNRPDCSGFCSACSPYGQCSCAECLAWPEEALNHHFHHDACSCSECTHWDEKKEEKEVEHHHHHNCSCSHHHDEKERQEVNVEVAVSADDAEFNPALQLSLENPFDA